MEKHSHQESMLNGSRDGVGGPKPGKSSFQPGPKGWADTCMEFGLATGENERRPVRSSTQGLGCSLAAV